MTVYEVIEALLLEEAKKAGQFANLYLTRLREGNAEAEVSATLSQECFRNAAALRVALAEMPVELAEREI
jgi:hypothetical protein